MAMTPEKLAAIHASRNDASVERAEARAVIVGLAGKVFPMITAKELADILQTEEFKALGGSTRRGSVYRKLLSGKRKVEAGIRATALLQTMVDTLAVGGIPVDVDARTKFIALGRFLKEIE